MSSINGQASIETNKVLSKIIEELMEYFPAPAKVNLFLRVIGRREDGYHDLQTVFRFIDLSDSIGLRVTDSGVVRRISDQPWRDEDDLAVKAAKLLQQVTGSQYGVDLDIIKRVPVGGGLGGGSSDAATTLIMLNRLWRLDMSRAQLCVLSKTLGADVPFFIYGQSAFAGGIGDKLSAVELSDAVYLVVYPNCFVSTTQIFSDPELTRNSKPIKIADFSQYEGQNDLQNTVCRLHPEVGAAISWLEDYGKPFMSGSGSSVVCSFDSIEGALDVMNVAPKAWTVHVTQGVDQHPLSSWLVK